MTTEPSRLDRLEERLLGPLWPMLILLTVPTFLMITVVGLDRGTVLPIMFGASFAVAIIRTVWFVRHHAPADDD